MLDPNQATVRQPSLVGQFIRSKREALGLSQRALGLLFTPAVTTQFISNVERGVTPLPPVHIPTLCQALKVQNAEILGILEKEYVAKLSGRLGHGSEAAHGADFNSAATRANFIPVASKDYDFWQKLYSIYQNTDPNNQKAFETICENMFKIYKKSAEGASHSAV